MTTNINSEVIMQSESRNWFVALLNRVFHRTKNNPKINSHHNPEERKIVLEGALNSLIVKPKVEQWMHNKNNEQTTSNFESTEQGTQPSSLADAEPTIKSTPEVMTAEKLNIYTADLAERIAANEKVASPSSYRSSNPFPSDTVLDKSIHADQEQQNTASRINVTNDNQINANVMSQSGELIEYKTVEVPLTVINPSASLIEAINKSSGPDNKELVRSEVDPTTIKAADLTAGAVRLIYTSVLNNDPPVLNLADDQLAKQKLESCVAEPKEENDEMAVAKSTVEMTSDEVIDYAQERVKESPLKKTLAGIKFPKRKVVKVVDRTDENKDV